LAVERLLGALLLVVAGVAGLIGVPWLLLDAFGTEWDYCPGGRDCIAGWKMGAAFASAAVVTGGVGVVLLRRDRRGSRGGERLN
jgi:hypothetical protein